MDKEEIIKETLKMVGDSILILDEKEKITPEHFDMPIRYALDRYEEEIRKPKCPICGEAIENAIDRITKKTSKYLWKTKCGHTENLRLSIG